MKKHLRNKLLHLGFLQISIPLSLGTTTQPITKSLPEHNLAMIESSVFTNIHSRQYDVTGLLYLDQTGNLREVYSWILKSVNWKEEK